MTATHVARGSSHGMKLMQGSSAMRGNPRGRRFVEAVGRMRIKSLDDMAEREMAKQQQRSKQGKFTSAKEFDELVKAMPDPAGEQDGLLADGAWRVLRGVFCVLCSVFYVLRSAFCDTCHVLRDTCDDDCSSRCDHGGHPPESSQVPRRDPRRGRRYGSGIQIAGSLRAATVLVASPGGGRRVYRPASTQVGCGREA